MIPFDDRLRATMTTNLSSHPRVTVDDESLRPAAVAIVIVNSQPDDDDDPFPLPEQPLINVPGDIAGLDGRMRNVSGGAAFLLCRRAARMNRHAGQWALPGGRLDADETPIDAALRELHEELGLQLGVDSVLGVLDDYPTRSGFRITPVVVWGGHDVRLTPDPGEVAHTYRIGLHQLCRADSPRYVRIPESDRPVVQLPLGGDLIHAPTGAVLLQLRWVAIEGKLGERVDHLEQPVFAWG